jgi:hypothetical protein
MLSEVGRKRKRKRARTICMQDQQQPQHPSLLFFGKFTQKVPPGTGRGEGAKKSSKPGFSLSCQVSLVAGKKVSRSARPPRRCNVTLDKEKRKEKKRIMRIKKKEKVFAGPGQTGLSHTDTHDEVCDKRSMTLLCATGSTYRVARPPLSLITAQP